MTWRSMAARLSWPGRYRPCGEKHPHPCQTVTCTRPVGHQPPHMRPLPGRIVTWRSVDEQAVLTVEVPTTTEPVGTLTVPTTAHPWGGA